MVSIEPPFDMLDRHIKHERDYRYPPPPQTLFDVSADPLAFQQDPFAYGPSAFYQQSTYARSSPTAHPVDDRSNLSSASAASSAVGSPQSNPGQLASVPSWAAPQSLGVTPNIVGHPEYLGAAAEYGAFTGMDDYGTFDFAGGKPPGFVGEFANVSTTTSAASRPQIPFFTHRGSLSVASGLQSGPEGGQAAPGDASPQSASSHQPGGSFVPCLSPSISQTSHSPPLASSAGWDNHSPQTPRTFSWDFYSQGGGQFMAPPQSSCSFFSLRRGGHFLK